MRRPWTLLVLLCSCADPNCKMVLRPSPRPTPEFEQLEEPKPRCSAADPRCGPEPLLRDKPLCFKPAATRERLPPGGEPPPPATHEFRCSHDGQCQIAGCGNVCVAYPYSQIETNCVGYDWLDDRALCGCVNGSCSFFRQ